MTRATGADTRGPSCKPANGVPVEGIMGISEKDEPLLWDFIYWVRKRRPNVEDAPVNDKTLEYVAQGIELFLQGKKNPWPQKRGMKPNPELMWLCYQLACVVDQDTEFLPQHKGNKLRIDGYRKIGNLLNLSPSGVESHIRNAQKLRDTPDGMQKFHDWLNHREKRWWFYHAECVEKKELKLLEYIGKVEGDTSILTNGGVEVLPLTRKDADALVAEAQELRKEWWGSRTTRRGLPSTSEERRRGKLNLSRIARYLLMILRP